MAQTLAEMAADGLELPLVVVQRLIATAPTRYKVYRIPKRRPGQFRTIAQPAREVKALQYWLLRSALTALPIHDVAAAYIPGRGIRDNAAKHSRNEFLLKLDFTKFFPSITSIDFRAYLSDMSITAFPERDVDSAINIIFWRPKLSNELRLSIGAPTSPHVSNAIMWRFDDTLDAFCRKLSVTYTRYADDMTFSTNRKRILRDVHAEVIRMCELVGYPKLQLNEDKTIFSSKKHRRRVTGLILSNEGKVSLGRQKKREIRAMIDKFRHRELDEESARKLKGIMAFAMDVEPEFVQRMKVKYGELTIERIQRI